MATLPTVPGPFTDLTVPSVAQLQQLSQAVSFITDCTTRPLWHFYKTSTASLTASTWNSIPYSQVAYDNDGVHVSSAATIVTRGYYSVEACMDFAAGSSSITILGAFLWTAGGNNPHFTSGTTLRFGARGGSACSDGSADPALCITDVCPNVCYPGDSIQPQAWVSAAVTLKYNTNDAYNQGRYVANFTGMWLANGT